MHDTVTGTATAAGSIMTATMTGSEVHDHQLDFIGMYASDALVDTTAQWDETTQQGAPGQSVSSFAWDWGYGITPAANTDIAQWIDSAGHTNGEDTHAQPATADPDEFDLMCELKSVVGELKDRLHSLNDEKVLGLKEFLESPHTHTRARHTAASQELTAATPCTWAWDGGKVEAGPDGFSTAHARPDEFGLLCDFKDVVGGLKARLDTYSAEVTRGLNDKLESAETIRGLQVKLENERAYSKQLRKAALALFQTQTGGNPVLQDALKHTPYQQQPTTTTQPYQLQYLQPSFNQVLGGCPPKSSSSYASLAANTAAGSAPALIKQEYGQASTNSSSNNKTCFVIHPPAAQDTCKTVCPHCMGGDKNKKKDSKDVHAASSSGSEHDDGSTTPEREGGSTSRQPAQRRRRSMLVKRSTNKVGKWWQRYGYAGPPYCQRCSEIFRDHIIRQISNSAGCSRANPCHDCGTILKHFKTSKEKIWQLIEQKCREKAVRAGVSSTKRKGSPSSSSSSSSFSSSSSSADSHAALPTTKTKARPKKSRKTAKGHPKREPSPETPAHNVMGGTLDPFENLRDFRFGSSKLG